MYSFPLLIGILLAALTGAGLAAATVPRPQLVLAYSGFGVGNHLEARFVLYADGRLLYRDEAARPAAAREGPWMSVRLDDTERSDLTADVYGSLVERTRCIMPLYMVDAAVPTFYVERDGREIVRAVRGTSAGDKTPDLRDCDAIFEVANRLRAFVHERARPASDVEDLLPGASFWKQKMRLGDGG